MMHPEDSKLKETPFAALLPTLLKRESFSDVKLEGTDGLFVDANRHVLAVRSSVFDKLLCGPFQEAKAPIIKFDFSSNVLEAVVEYCYTDTAEMLEKDSTSATAILSLMQATDYFGLDGLLQKTKVYASSLVCSDVSLAFGLFQACKTVGSVSVEVKEMEELALDSIRKRVLPVADLYSGMLASLDGSVLESILKDDKMRATEYALFMLLKAWADAPGVDSSQRLKDARQLMPHIHLENIAPADLVNVVEMSDLVTSDQLKEAYKAQALRLDHPAYKRLRYTPPPIVWAGSQTSLLSIASDSLRICDKLICPPMKSGIHAWKLQVKNLSDNLSCEVGVISSCDSTTYEHVCHHHHGWSFFDDGEKYHNK